MARSRSDNIMKGFATSLAIVLSFCAGIVLFDFQVTASFLTGTIIVVGATYLYNQPDGPRPRSTGGVFPMSTSHGSPRHFIPSPRTSPSSSRHHSPKPSFTIGRSGSAQYSRPVEHRRPNGNAMTPDCFSNTEFEPRNSDHSSVVDGAGAGEPPSHVVPMGLGNGDASGTGIGLGRPPPHQSRPRSPNASQQRVSQPTSESITP